MVSWTWGRGAVGLSQPMHGMMSRVSLQLMRNLSVNSYWATAGYPTDALASTLASSLADFVLTDSRSTKDREHMGQALSHIWRCIASMALVASRQVVDEAALQLESEIRLADSIGAGFNELVPGLRRLSRSLAMGETSCGVFCAVLSLARVEWRDVDFFCAASVAFGSGDAFFSNRLQGKSGHRLLSGVTGV